MSFVNLVSHNLTRSGRLALHDEARTRPDQSLPLHCATGSKQKHSAMFTSLGRSIPAILAQVSRPLGGKLTLANLTPSAATALLLVR